ncbi:hypothetical protein HQ489_02195 [Candidatus Woesearchaeota archaeon]|nr:hypothetical protein [Candidatus Woesearchaeota archaeon]
MSEFGDLRKKYPDFDDLCDARDEVVRLIGNQRLITEALKEQMYQWDHKIETRYRELLQ